MHQSGWFIVQDKEDHVSLLKKSLYGLKQSPRQWYKQFDTFMVGHGYPRSDYDSCVYGTSSLILLWLVMITHEVIMTVAYHRKLQDDSFNYLMMTW